MKSMSPLEEIRHSASHVLATAVLRLFPETKLDIGPPTVSYTHLTLPTKA